MEKQIAKKGKNMKFIKLHDQGDPRLVNLDTVSLFFVQGGKTKVCFDGEEYIFVDERLDDVAKIIYEAEVAGSNSETATGEWISVEERLPAEDVRVLVWLRKDHKTTYTRIDTDRRLNGVWVRWYESVTHWMPLPEPPKGVVDANH